MFIRITSCLAMMLTARPAAADGARELPARGHTLAEAAVFARYDRLPGEVDGARVGLSARAAIGGGVGYCVGADLGVGGTGQGVVYGAALQLAGVGVRIGNAGLVAACAGVGVGGAAGVVPAAVELPVELRARGQLGPVRLAARATARWTAFADRRDGGSRVDEVDELELEVAVGWGRQHRYWGRASAGTGPYVTFVYRELMGERVVALGVGVDLLGAE